MKELILNV